MEYTNFRNNTIIKKYSQSYNFPDAIISLQKKSLLKGVAIKNSDENKTVSL